MRKIDLTGKKFGKLTVLEETESQYTPNGAKHKMWLCKCECGNTKKIKQIDLRRDHTKSCGCLSTKHGYNRKNTIGIHPLYKKWGGMIGRCHSKKTKSYKNYGAIGIKVCDEWKNNPVTFIKWAEQNGYKEELVLDRINTNGNYEPSNV